MWASRETGGGQRGSALCPVPAQRWEAVFRRERRPASLDRNFRGREEGFFFPSVTLPGKGKALFVCRFLPAHV